MAPHFGGGDILDAASIETFQYASVVVESRGR